MSGNSYSANAPLPPVETVCKDGSGKQRASWPANEAACYGVTCTHHLDCQRYQAVEGNTNPRQVYIAMCGPTLPLYIQAPKEKA